MTPYVFTNRASVSARAVICTFALFALFATSAHGCMVLLSRDQPGTVRIAKESAIIVWDPLTHTERFIRAASFDTSAKSFGFLVPTPTVPVLHEADPQSLETLNALFRPHELRDQGGALAPDVDVIRTQTVAGLDATSLKAADTRALGRWMMRNGFAWNSDIDAWLAPYVARHWTINAFKFAQTDNDTKHLQTQLLCMSFHVNAPFFPYSEPANQRDARAPHGPRRLQLFLLGPTRMVGRMASNANHVTWPGLAWYSGPIDATTLSSLETEISVNLPTRTCLTMFEDDSSPRPGYADVVFTGSR